MGDAKQKRAGKDSASRPRGRPKGSTKAARYAGLVSAGVPRTKAIVQAGYSPTTQPACIETLPTVRHALATVEQQREEIQQDPGFAFRDIAHRLKNRAVNPEVNAKTQLDNDKALISILGYDAPKQVSIRSTGLLLEFTDLTAADLAAIREDMGADIGADD